MSAAEFQEVIDSQPPVVNAVAMMKPPIFETLGRQIMIKLIDIPAASIPKSFGRYTWKNFKEADKERVIKAFC